VKLKLKEVKKHHPKLVQVFALCESTNIHVQLTVAEILRLTLFYEMKLEAGNILIAYYTYIAYKLYCH
jgi:hypothetical protein